MKKFNILLISGLSLLCSCSSDSPKPAVDIIHIPEMATLELTPSEKTANTNINDAAFTLLNQMASDPEYLKENNGNICLSPVSIYMAMSMIANSVEDSEDGI